jgi:hypothetical protein
MKAMEAMGSKPYCLHIIDRTGVSVNTIVLSAAHGAMRSLSLALTALALSVQSAYAWRTATAFAQVAYGFVVAIQITDGGEGYMVAPRVVISGGGGTGATAQAILEGLFRIAWAFHFLFFPQSANSVLVSVGQFGPGESG